MKIQVLATAILIATTTSTMGATLVPTSYEAGHFYATPTLASGEVLKILVDTGGSGGNWGLTAAVGEKLGLATVACKRAGKCFEPPVFAPGKGLPELKPRGLTDVDISPAGTNQGVLGGWYLSAGVWTFDYPARRLVLEDATWKPGKQSKSTAMGFPSNNAGKIGTPYPRITITVDHEPMDLLLDTGATAHPTEAGKKAQGTDVAADGFAGGSYITTSVMNRWHEAHPDWPLVDAADDLFGAKKATRAIRVPAVEIAGWITGPVWFVEREDINFDSEQGMSQWMDKEIHGSAGGNIYAPFRMTLDYAHRKAWFTCVSGCKASRL
jgi:hypothetical protein